MIIIIIIIPFYLDWYLHLRCYTFKVELSILLQVYVIFGKLFRTLNQILYSNWWKIVLILLSLLKGNNSYQLILLWLFALLIGFLFLCQSIWFSCTTEPRNWTPGCHKTSNAFNQHVTTLKQQVNYSNKPV